jgi:Ca-activated chloride channel family protein
MRLALPGLVAASLHLFAQSSPPPDFSVDASLVLVSVTALDHNGNLVPDLHLEDFGLQDEGKSRPIEKMWREDSTPLTIGLIADTSGSQLSVIPQHQRTLTQFLEQVLRPQDQAFLVSIPFNVRMVVDLTHSVNDLQKGVGKLFNPFGNYPQFGDPCLTRMIPGIGMVPLCSTALWDAVHGASNLRMRQIEGRKALIVLSDGLDNGSKCTLRDAIDAAQRSGTPVYTIYTGRSSLLDGKKPLARLSDDTGGRAYRGSDEKGSQKIFDQIETELRTTYVLAFRLPPDARDGKFHKLKVTSKRRGLIIRTRTGYFADK